MARKTRVVVSMDDDEREIFSIEEKPKGDIILALPHTRPRSMLHAPEIQNRFSFHVSGDSHDGGFQIKQTSKTSGYPEINRYAYVRPKDGYTTLHAFARVSASLRKSPSSAYKKRHSTCLIENNYIGGPFVFVLVVSRQIIDLADFQTA